MRIQEVTQHLRAMFLRSRSQTTSLASRTLEAVVFLLFAGIICLSARAKAGQYLPHSNPAHNLSRVSKMTESPAHQSIKRVLLRERPQPEFRADESTSELPVLENIIPLSTITLRADQLRSPPAI